MMSPRTGVGVLCAVFLAAAACSNNSKTAPAPARTIQALVINGVQSVAEGESATLSAAVRWSDGTTETLTSGVTWLSETPSVVTVTNQGVVTAVAAGTGTVRATYASVSGTTSLNVQPGIRVITGRVHESKPTEHIAVPGATVIGEDSAGIRETAITDKDGTFTVRLKPGTIRLTVSADTYETTTHVVDLPNAGLAGVDVGIKPAFREMYVVVPRIPTETSTERTFRIGIHHSGELRVRYTASGQSASSQWGTCMEVRDSTNRVLDHRQGSYDAWAGPITLNVTGGETYEVKLFSCAPPVASPQYTLENILLWSAEIKHPS